MGRRTQARWRLRSLTERERERERERETESEDGNDREGGSEKVEGNAGGL